MTKLDPRTETKLEAEKIVAGSVEFWTAIPEAFDKDVEDRFGDDVRTMHAVLIELSTNYPDVWAGIVAYKNRNKA